MSDLSTSDFIHKECSTTLPKFGGQTYHMFHGLSLGITVSSRPKCIPRRRLYLLSKGTFVSHLNYQVRKQIILKLGDSNLGRKLAWKCFCTNWQVIWEIQASHHYFQFTGIMWVATEYTLLCSHASGHFERNSSGQKDI